MEKVRPFCFSYFELFSTTDVNGVFLAARVGPASGGTLKCLKGVASILNVFILGLCEFVCAFGCTLGSTMSWYGIASHLEHPNAPISLALGTLPRPHSLAAPHTNPAFS